MELWLISKYLFIIVRSSEHLTCIRSERTIYANFIVHCTFMTDVLHELFFY